MELILTRSYYKGGTNGTVFCEGEKLCHTIELPWENNKPCFSCIPEGVYELKKRYTLYRGEHLLVSGVPGRKLILIHPANNAGQQLLGCIAPVTTLTGDGEGSQSQLATNLLYREVSLRIEREQVWLRITSPTGEPAVVQKVRPLVRPFTVPVLQAA